MLFCRSQTPVTIRSRRNSGSSSPTTFSRAAVIFPGCSPAALRAISNRFGDRLPSSSVATGTAGDVEC